jgi:hypothetical protein
MPARGLAAAQAFEAQSRVRAIAEDDGIPGNDGWKVVFAAASILADRIEFGRDVTGSTIADAREGVELALWEAAP